MHIKDLTTDELKALIRETVMETLEELLPDPDEGRTVKAEFKQELMAICKRRKKGGRRIPAEEVMDRLGLGG